MCFVILFCFLQSEWCSVLSAHTSRYYHRQYISTLVHRPKKNLFRSGLWNSNHEHIVCLNWLVYWTFFIIETILNTGLTCHSYVWPYFWRTVWSNHLALFQLLRLQAFVKMFHHNLHQISMNVFDTHSFHSFLTQESCLDTTSHHNVMYKNQIVLLLLKCSSLDS